MAQTKQEQPDALAKMAQFVGVWQAAMSKDTIEQWECQPYGKGLTIHVTYIVKGQKTPVYFNTMGIDARDGKVKGYALWPNGDYTTWISVFDPSNKFLGEAMDTYTPGTTWGKFEMAILNPKEWTWKMWDMKGTLTGDLKFTKTK